MTPSKLPQFKRTLTLFDAIGIVVCAMIGSGIFIVTSQMATELHSGSLILLAWGLSALMSLIGALIYGELAAAWPEVGGQYAYIKNAWGKLPAFLYGWASSAIIKSGSIAAVAIGFAKFLSVFFPLIQTSGFQLGNLEISTQKLIAVGLILSLTLINTIGVKWVARLQNIVTVTNFTALIIIIGAGLFLGFNKTILLQNLNLSTLPPLNMQLLLPLGAALVGPLFALDGWGNITFIAAEIKKPERNLPLALITGVSVTSLLYLLVNLVYLAVLSLPSISHAANGVVGATLMRTIWGAPSATLVTSLILVAALGCVNSMILSGSRAIYALAKDGFLFKSVATLGSRSSVPEKALWLQCVWSVFLVFSRAFSELLDSMIFAALLFYGLTVAGIFILRKTKKQHSEGYKTWGYPWLPLIYCALSLWIITSVLVLKPISAGLSLIVVLAGLPVYLLTSQKRKQQPQVPVSETLLPENP